MATNYSLKLGKQRYPSGQLSGPAANGFPIESISFMTRGSSRGSSTGSSGFSSGRSGSNQIPSEDIVISTADSEAIIFLMHANRLGTEFLDAQITVESDSGQTYRYHLSNVEIWGWNSGSGADGQLRASVDLRFTDMSFGQAPASAAPKAPKTGAVTRGVLAAFKAAVSKP